MNKIIVVNDQTNLLGEKKKQYGTLTLKEIEKTKILLKNNIKLCFNQILKGS